VVKISPSITYYRKTPKFPQRKLLPGTQITEHCSLILFRVGIH